MRIKKSSSARYKWGEAAVISLLAGLFLGFAFAPFSIFLVPFVVFPLIFWGIELAEEKANGALFFIAGFFFFLFHLSWLKGIEWYFPPALLLLISLSFFS